MKSSRAYLVNLLVQGGSRAIAMFCGLASYILVARVLGAEPLGQYAFVIATVMIAGGIAEFGTTAVLARDLPGFRAGELDSARTYFGNYLFLRLLFVVLVMLVVAAISLFLPPDLRKLLLIALWAVPFLGARSLESVYQIYEKPIYTVYSGICLGVLQLLAAVVVLLVLQAGLELYLLSYVVVQGVYFLVSVLLACQLLPPRFQLRRQLLLTIAVASLPMGIWSVCQLIGYRIDVYALTYFQGNAVTGLYNAAYRLLDVATAIAITVSVPLVPYLTNRYREDAASTRALCVRLLQIAPVPLLLVPLLMPLVSQPVMRLLYGEAYVAGAVLLEVFAWALMVIVMNYLSMAINLAAGNVTHSWWNGVLFIGVSLALNLLLVPTQGARGAAVAVLVSSSGMLFVSLCYNYFNLRQRPGPI